MDESAPRKVAPTTPSAAGKTGAAPFSDESPYLCLWRAFNAVLLVMEAAQAGDADDGCKELAELLRRFKALDNEALASYLADCPTQYNAELPGLEVCGYSWPHVMFEAVRLICAVIIWSIRGAGETSLRIARLLGPPSELDETLARFEGDRLQHWPAIERAVREIPLSDFESDKVRLRVAQESDEIERRRATTAEPAPGPTAHSAMSKEAKALAVLCDHPDWTDDRVAEAAGCDRTSLYRTRNYVAAKKLLRNTPAIPRGSKDRESGQMEAWSDE